MTVDSDTTPYQRTIMGTTYYFCSDKCEEQFDKSPQTYIQLLTRLSADGGAGYTAMLAPVQALPGKPVSLQFEIRNNKTGKLVIDYQVTHTKLMHLLLVRSDFNWFEHQHPVLGKDGVFRLTWKFPSPGRYYLFADFTPIDGDNHIERMTLDVVQSAAASGPPPKPEGVVTVPASQTGNPPDLRPDRPHTVLVGDTQVAVAVVNPPFAVGKQMLLTYRFTDRDGKPVTDMQPFIGAMGHMIAIRSDATHCVHVHVIHGVAPGSYAASMLPVMQVASQVKVSPEMVTLTGPVFSFKLTLPAPGAYRIWAQFMRHNQVVTVPYTVRAEPEGSAAGQGPAKP
jgi:YHS domain-containing protein